MQQKVPQKIVKLHKMISITEKNYKPPSPKLMKELIHADPVPICFNNDEIVGQQCKKPCSDVQERNPITGRCVKKCLVGQERNPKTGRCVKTQKNNKSTIKSCTDVQERNPITGRCVKKCLVGQERNPKTGRCVKTKKNRNSK